MTVCGLSAAQQLLPQLDTRWKLERAVSLWSELSSGCWHTTSKSCYQHDKLWTCSPALLRVYFPAFFLKFFFKSHGFYLYVLYRSMRPIYYWCMCNVALYVGWFEAICVFWYLLLWFYWTSEEISLRNPEGRCWLFSVQKWNSSTQRGAAMLCTVCSWVCWIVWIYELSKFSQGRFQSHFCFFYSFTPLH